MLVDVIQPVETPQGFASTSFIKRRARHPRLLLSTGAKMIYVPVFMGNDLGVAPALGKSPTFAESAKMGHPSYKYS